MSWASLTSASLKWDTIRCLGTGLLFVFESIQSGPAFSESILHAVASCSISSVDSKPEVGFS